MMIKLWVYPYISDPAAYYVHLHEIRLYIIPELVSMSLTYTLCTCLQVLLMWLVVGAPVDADIPKVTPRV